MGNYLKLDYFLINESYWNPDRSFESGTSTKLVYNFQPEFKKSDNPHKVELYAPHIP